MLISEDYRKQQETLHENPDYGVASVGYAPIVTSLINQYNISELLDYGAGKGRLAESIRPNHNVNVSHYDPGRPEWSDTPKPCQMVCCIDVLEHIEPELIDNVLDDLKRVTVDLGFYTVHTGAAVKVLPDGRNAHLIQKPARWWMSKFWDRFEVKAMIVDKHGFYVVTHGD